MFHHCYQGTIKDSCAPNLLMDFYFYDSRIFFSLLTIFMRMFYTSSSKYEDDDDVDKRIWSIESKKKTDIFWNIHSMNKKTGPDQKKSIMNVTGQTESQ